MVIYEKGDIEQRLQIKSGKQVKQKFKKHYTARLIWLCIYGSIMLGQLQQQKKFNGCVCQLFQSNQC